MWCVFYSIGLRGAAPRPSPSCVTEVAQAEVGCAQSPRTTRWAPRRPPPAPRRPASTRPPPPPPHHRGGRGPARHIPPLSRPAGGCAFFVGAIVRSSTCSLSYHHKTLARSPPHSRRRCMLTRDRRHRSAKAPSRAVSQADAPRPSARKTRNQGAPCTRGGRPDAGPSRAARVGGGGGVRLKRQRRRDRSAG